MFGIACDKNNNNIRKLNFCLLFANYFFLKIIQNSQHLITMCDTLLTILYYTYNTTLTVLIICFWKYQASDPRRQDCLEDSRWINSYDPLEKQ